MLLKNRSHKYSEAPFKARPSLSFSTARQYLDARRIELGEIFEGEHQAFDALRRITVCLSQRFEEFLLCRTIKIVEDIGHRFVRITPRGAG